MNRIPMRALNIDIHLRRAVTAKGFDGVPEKTEKASPGQPRLHRNTWNFYCRFICNTAAPLRKRPKNQKPNHYDPDFLRFVVSQQLWDRAMAQEIHAVLSSYDKHKKPLIVGIMGSGHILKGFGVPHQLKTWV